MLYPYSMFQFFIRWQLRPFVTKFAFKIQLFGADKDTITYDAEPHPKQKAPKPCSLRDFAGDQGAGI